MFRYTSRKLRAFNLLLIVIILTCYSCNNTDDRYEPVYDLYSDVELMHLLIDEKKVAELQLNNENHFEGIELFDFFSGSDFLVLKGDSLITVSNSREMIRVVDSTIGEELGRYSFLGRGPGEYQRIDKLLYSDGYFLIIDSSLAKILLFDEKFNFVDESELSDMFPQSGFAYRHPHLYYPKLNDSEYLVQKRSIINREKLSDFHSRIISIGKQPSGYNRILMDINSKRELLVASVQMPLLFFYGTDTSIDNILRIRYDDFEPRGEQVEFDARIGQRVLNNPPPIEIETDMVIKGRNIISNLIYKDDEVIFIHSGMVTFLKKSGNRYEHWKSFRMFDQDGSPFYPMHIASIKDEIYLSSRFKNYIVRINTSII